MSETHSHWIDSLFARLGTRYGSAWLNLWEGFDLEAVKTDWRLELEGLPLRKIKYGIVNLPLERPPATVAAFKAICIRCPDEQPPLLDAPPANPERVNAIVSQLRTKLAKRHRLQWAYDLQEREKRGDSLSMAQQTAWRDALVQAPHTDMEFKGIDPACLPPGMRPREQHSAYVRAEHQALDQFYGDEERA